LIDERLFCSIWAYVPEVVVLDNNAAIFRVMNLGSSEEEWDKACRNPPYHTASNGLIESR